jgi:hypothetical protein
MTDLAKDLAEKGEIMIAKNSAEEELVYCGPSEPISSCMFLAARLDMLAKKKLRTGSDAPLSHDRQEQRRRGAGLLMAQIRRFLFDTDFSPPGGKPGPAPRPGRGPPAGRGRRRRLPTRRGPRPRPRP